MLQNIFLFIHLFVNKNNYNFATCKLLQKAIKMLILLSKNHNKLKFM